MNLLRICSTVCRILEWRKCVNSELQIQNRLRCYLTFDSNLHIFTCYIRCKPNSKYFSLRCAVENRAFSIRRLFFRLWAVAKSFLFHQLETTRYMNEIPEAGLDFKILLEHVREIILLILLLLLPYFLTIPSCWFVFSVWYISLIQALGLVRIRFRTSTIFQITSF